MEFITAHIYSVSQLEVLLLLWRNKDRLWSAHEVGKALYTNESAASDLLTVLSANKLVEKESVDGNTKYRFPAEDDGNLNEVVSRIAQTYSERKVRLVEFILSSGKTGAPAPSTE